SVAEGLLHRLTVPILLHRFDPDAPVSERLRAAPPFRTVLAALDGSADAAVALDRALELVEPAGRLILFRVADPPPLLSSTYLPHAAVIQRAEEERRREEALSYLDRTLERVGGGTVEMESHMVVDRHPADAILSLAAADHADLVALGSHGHGALRQTLFGSVTHAVLQKSSVPALVARRGP
ncbi:MAG TPA: universal stress protein, partial [Longimicrobiales bacterium]|nr:universal stress protein [Longimicrobiales bacterium]